MTTATNTTIDVSIQTSSKRLAEACVTRDWDALLDLCTDDVVFLPPDEPAVSGKQIRPWLDNYPRIERFEIELTHVECQEQLASAWGRFTMSFTPFGSSKPITIHGKVSDTFRKDLQGNWRYASVMWNASLPMPLVGRALASW